MEGKGTCCDITKLPLDCIAHVLSLTTPRDACRAAAATTAFRFAMETDAVWEGFLPADYKDVLARAWEPLEFHSKRELYFRLCRPFLIDGGRKSFWLDVPTGKKCCMMSARDLQIAWGDTPRHWSWVSLPGSRFSEVAELLSVWSFQIGANLSTSMLTAKTTYVVYLVYRLTPRAQGLSSPPQEASITIGLYFADRAIRLQQSQQRVSTGRTNKRRRICHTLDWVQETGRAAVAATAAAEVVLGEFFVGEGYDEEVEIVLLETTGVWKTGLIVEGIEVRPKN